MATIKDVAREAGLAVGTVSRVLNNKSVKQANVLKVEAAIKKLNYEVNTYARGLKVQRTYTVALILPTIWHPFFSALTYYIELELAQQNYKLLICNSEGNPEKELSYINMAKQNKVDGIIGITYSDIETYISKDLPFVSVDRHFSHKVPCITCDNEQGGEIAFNQLFQLGCKNPAFISYGSSFDNETQKRKIGFIKACTTHHMTPVVLDLIEPIDNLNAHFKSFIQKHIIESLSPIDGIFAITDFVALQFIDQLSHFGLRVPEDVQIIGFDGIQSFKEDTPTISSIKQPANLMAKQAVHILLQMIDGETVPDLTILPVEFVQGKTTCTLNKNTFL